MSGVAEVVELRQYLLHPGRRDELIDLFERELVEPQEQAGMAILCHPENFRAPQHMRLHPSEPFFCYAPQQGGDMEIAPGKKYVSRYRFVVHDGPPNKEVIDRLWNDYASPPKVTVQ